MKTTKQLQEELEMLASGRIFLEEAKTTIEIPNNATNGDMIEAMFSVETIDDFCHSFGVRLNNSNYIQFNKNWWNAPYKKGDK